MNLNTLRIGSRLGAAFALVVAGAIAIAAVAIFQMSIVGNEADFALDIQAGKLAAVTDLRKALYERAAILRQMALTSSAQERDALAAKMKEMRTLYEHSRDALGNSPLDSREAALLKLLDAEREKATPLVEKAMSLIVANASREEIVQAIVNDSTPAQARTLDAAATLQGTIQQNANKAGDDVQARIRNARMLIAVVAALAVAAGVAAAWAITRSITRPLASAIELAEQVARGDLTHHVSAEGSDEVAQLLQALDRMQKSLREIVGKVRSGVDSVSSACTQIAAGNRDLSSRTEQQASSLQETAASMEQMNSTVRQNADNAKQANQLAVTASEVAMRGGSVVERVVETMDDISAQSRKIAEIIGVIDGIAFQTNILALNAAVEAARAGEQGRGFAVVAGEVRNLAQRSAQAAREIKSLIGTSVERVEAGGKQVAEAGATMGEIVSQVKRVTDLIGEITAATVEQSGGIGQVNLAVTQLDQMTQQNAALVEQSTAAAESLRDQADELAKTVSAFRLAQEASLARPASATAPRPGSAPMAKPAQSARVSTALKPATASASGAPKASPAVADAPRAPAAATKPQAAPPAAVTKVEAKTASDDWEEF